MHRKHVLKCIIHKGHTLMPIYLIYRYTVCFHRLLDSYNKESRPLFMPARMSLQAPWKYQSLQFSQFRLKSKIYLKFLYLCVKSSFHEYVLRPNKVTKTNLKSIALGIILFFNSFFLYDKINLPLHSIP